MSKLLLLILAIIAVFAISRILRRGGTDGGTHRTDDPGTDPTHGNYAAVSIHTYRNGCPPAEALRGRRFLVNEAPLLPLADCNWSRCNCRYLHHSDRRTGTGDRRRHPAEPAADSGAFDGKDRRASVGRRASDLSAARGLADAGPA